MQFHINKFIFISTIQFHNSKTYTHLNKKVKAIVLNKGSHTRLIQYLNNQKTNIEILQKKEKKLVKNIRQIRYVWLETSVYTKITFARSLWTIVNNKKPIKELKITIPIGHLLIKNKADINKTMYEIYFCYCKDLEKKLRLRGEIWGRKYMISQKNNISILIQEFFSPSIMFFN
uniref:Uncharacterized protein n=1 Tax=Polysiphonia urceolata TaxID=173545 RepID=A0A1Z1MBW6_POLUR|nr:hypothetical protein [Polysiphonia stricta]ARW63470.1 hypothetical protein [Polysiphonia stricta]